MLFVAVVGNTPKNYRTQIKLDESLFVRIGQNDKDALEELYHKTERALYAYVLSLVRSTHDTYDLVQETYLKIRASAQLYRPQGKPMAWIFTIAKNLSISHLRRQAELAGGAEADFENNLEYSYVSDPTDRMVLAATLNKLSGEEREIILLHLVAGLRHREIAEDLDIPLSTALSRYHRGLKKLRKHLMEQEVIL
jgi:RNA polymerase sigma factor (sigma-70 family)